MKRLVRWLVAVAVVGLLAWIVLQRAGTPVPVPGALAPAAAPAGNAAPPAVGVTQGLLDVPGPPPQRLPRFADSAAEAARFGVTDVVDFEWWNAPFDAVLDDLRAWAAAGDLYAGRILANRLQACLPDGLRSTEASIAENRSQLDARLATLADGEAVSDPRVVTLNRLIERAEGTRRACARVPAAWQDDAPGLVQRAANNGDGRARSEYGRLALAVQGTTDDVLANLDRVVEIQQRARGYLEQELAAGNGDVLAMADLGGSDLRDLGVPEATRLAWLHAYREWRRRQALDGVVMAAIDREWDRATRNLPPAERAAIEAQGNALFARCCGAPPRP
jgi:hypothetical protein